MDYWYNFIDKSCERGGDKSGFLVIVSSKYVNNILSNIDTERLKKEVSELSTDFNNLGNLGLDCKIDEEDPNLFWSMSHEQGRYGLDRVVDGYLESKYGEEIIYSTHNCSTPIQRFSLERAFFVWARLIEQACF